MVTIFDVYQDGLIGAVTFVYAMKYEESFSSEDYPNGIPAEQFGYLITEYLPVTAEQIREWAVFDKVMYGQD